MKIKTGIFLHAAWLGVLILSGCSLPSADTVATSAGLSQGGTPNPIATASPSAFTEPSDVTPNLDAVTPDPAGSSTQPNPGASPTTRQTAAISPTPTAPVNPLTGLPPDDPQLLERRSVLVKIENLPRSSRPQWGLSLADLVFEYHSEEGTTRFAALFYGNNAEQIGPIRSGRLFDIQLVYMYRSQFVFGFAYRTVLDEIRRQEFADRLIVENTRTAPALYRIDPTGRNFLMLNLNKLDAVLKKNNIDNTPQDLSDMAFQHSPPSGGEPASQVFVRYSSAIYNRWDYDPSSGKYLRFSDKANAFSPAEETYAQLMDKLNGQPIAVENVVMVVVKNEEVQRNIYEIHLDGTGQAFIARDGLIYEVQWYRGNADDILVLQDMNGNPFPFKPGQTWFEILSDPTGVENKADAWRFTFRFPRD